jgi:hypothetical protein
MSNTKQPYQAYITPGVCHLVDVNDSHESSCGKYMDSMSYLKVVVVNKVDRTISSLNKLVKLQNFWKNKKRRRMTLHSQGGRTPQIQNLKITRHSTHSYVLPDQNKYKINEKKKKMD